MEDVQSWLTNGYNSTSIFSNSPSLSHSSSSATTHSAPTLCEEDSSFNSIRSISINYSISKPSISHFCIASIKPTASQISCLAVHDNILYAATIKEINAFDLTTLSLIETFGSGSGWAKSIAFSNKKIFTAHQDCKIRVWQQVVPTSSSSAKQKHQLISTLPTLKDRFRNCMLAKNYVQVRRHKQKLWIEHADAVSGLAVNNDLGQLYSVSWDKSFKTWKTSSEMRCVDSVTAAHSDAVNPYDKTVYTGSADGKIKVWVASDDRKKRVSPITLSKHDSSVNAIALRREGSGLISGGGDGVILVWERREGGEDLDFIVGCCLKGHRGGVLCLVSVNDLLISGSSDTSVRIWKYEKGWCLAVMEGHCKPVKSLVAVADGDGDLDQGFSVYSGSLDGEIRAWKLVLNSFSP
ncbi:hypothetical protein C2S52_015361 [Perilla frutescens var. hirtella]|nr:hypothetical protein C2S52_015361 [Perilla frutescens var. hirtella]